MDREKLKLIVRHLELLLDSLKVEIHSDSSSQLNPDRQINKKPILDYDEILEDFYLNG